MSQLRPPYAARALRLVCLLVSGLLASLWITVGAWAKASPEAWDQTESLYATGEYAKALEGFGRLAEVAEGDAAVTARALMRMGDCIQVGGIAEVGGPDEAYAQALEQGYSPYLAEAFRKWRAAFQMFNHGVSNFSEIPNAEYNARKERVLATVRVFLTAHHDDSEARDQQALLEQLPDITPGGPMGSSVLNEMAMLWPEMLRDDTRASHDEKRDALLDAVERVESAWPDEPGASP